jgi:hypothetical protein
MNKLKYLALAVIVASGTLLPLGLASASTSATAGATTKQIAVSTLSNEIRANLTAIRGSGGTSGAPSATVKIAVFKRSAGVFKLVGRQLVGARNAWFWNVVTGEGGICLFSASDQSPYPLEVRLLVSDSIGCSATTFNFHIDKYGNLVAG